MKRISMACFVIMAFFGIGLTNSCFAIAIKNSSDGPVIVRYLSDDGLPMITDTIPPDQTIEVRPLDRFITATGAYSPDGRALCAKSTYCTARQGGILVYRNVEVLDICNFTCG